MTHTMWICIIALAALAIGVAGVRVWGRRRSHVYFVIADENGSAEFIGPTSAEAWASCCAHLFEFHEFNTLEGAKHEARRRGYRCARVRVTEIGGE